MRRPRAHHQGGALEYALEYVLGWASDDAAGIYAAGAGVRHASERA